MHKYRNNNFYHVSGGMMFFAALLFFYNIFVLQNPAAQTSAFIAVGVLWLASYVYITIFFFRLFSDFNVKTWFAFFTFVTPLIPFFIYVFSSKGSAPSGNQIGPTA